MKNTEAVRAAFSQMQRQAENLGAGYKIEPRVWTPSALATSE